MSTLEVIKFRDIIPVRSVNRFLPGVTPRTIEISGEDFSNADEVLINDSIVPEFVIVNKTTMYVQLPSDAQQIRTISIRSANFTRTSEASRIDYKVGNKTRAISGILRLTQLFVRYLLTSQGSDIYHPNEGGGLQDVVGILGSTNKTAPILSAVNSAVRRTTDQIVRNQLNLPGLSLDERLLSASVLDLRTTQGLDEVVARVLLVSYAGNEATVNLQL